MRQRTVKLSSRLGLLSFMGIAAPGLAAAQPAGTADGDEALETVVVTGSRIRQTESEGPSPVVRLSGAELEAQGFTTVYEALKSFTQVTGVAQDDQYTGGFTQNANAINMRGLGPGRTLILLNGRRISDYPLPYNGESNFVNIAAIPVAAIERIEVLSGGASAIYGSDAIAGVVNIILHENIDTPLDLNFRVGNTTQGGGKSIRVQGVGGFNHDLLNVTYALEYLKRDPIFGFQRNFMDSIADNPSPSQQLPARAILRDQLLGDSDGDGFDYFDPGAACDSFPGFERAFRPGFGYFCGQPGASAQRTIRNGRDQGSLYTNATLDLGGVEVFGSLNYFHSNSELDDNATYWYPGVAPDFYYVYDESTGILEGLQRYFLPFEQGGYDARFSKFKEDSWNVTGGARGDLGATGWKYEATVNYSHYKVDNRVRRFLFDQIEEYFLGPRSSAGFDPFLGIFPAYVEIPFDRLYSPVSPDVYNQFTAITREIASSSVATASAVLTGDLLQLPAGALSTAGIVEWGTQRYRIHPDPGIAAGDYWGLSGTGGGGDRDRYAAGVEFSIPIVESLRASLAGRYDKYDDITQLDDALTYKAGLEYRPIDMILVRGSASSSFRAPDMHYVFADPSGSFESARDYYLCRRDESGVPLSSCTNGSVAISSARTGNPRLKEETGKSFTVGFVIQPLSAMKLSVDYYHMDLDDLVLDRPLDNILQAEADCRLGQTSFGAPVNVNSSECQDALARVSRNPTGGPFAERLSFVATGPFNTANYTTSGLDTQLSYNFEPLAIGRFAFQTAYTHVLKFELQNFAGDPVENARDDLQSFGQSDFRRFALRSHVRSNLTWDYQDVTATVFAERLGSVANWGQTGRIGPQTYFNASIEYRFMEDQASIGLLVNNVFDKNPPYDATNTEYPYFSIANYSPVGREVFVSLGYKFD